MLNSSFFVVLTTIVLILSGVNKGLTQTRKGEKRSSSTVKNEWITFSSPSKNFTVELSETPKATTKFAKMSVEKETDNDLIVFKCTKSLSYFSLRSLAKPKSNRLVISEFDVSGCTRSKDQFELDFLGFMLLLAGDNYRVLSDKTISVRGWKGHEIIYKNGSEINGRVLAIMAGEIIILVNYNRIGGDISEEERIFRTFKPKSVK